MTPTPEMNFSDISFVKSVYALEQLPVPEFAEVAFAGRSNVGKSSLINKLVNRRSLVKTSGRPGKTQSLNFFQVADFMYLVDLPGYGFARVSKEMQHHWQELISGYLQNRPTLRCVVVIIDIRHSLKNVDLELVNWLRQHSLPHLLVYTKTDKLSRSAGQTQAAGLDKGLGVLSSDRVMFSAKTGEGKEDLMAKLDKFLKQ